MESPKSERLGRLLTYTLSSDQKQLIPSTPIGEKYLGYNYYTTQYRLITDICKVY